MPVFGERFAASAAGGSVFGSVVGSPPGTLKRVEGCLGECGAVH
jgi:hypothetical protein